MKRLVCDGSFHLNNAGIPSTQIQVSGEQYHLYDIGIQENFPLTSNLANDTKIMISWGSHIPFRLNILESLHKHTALVKLKRKL